MSQNEMDELALLWSEAAAPAEEQRVRRSAWQAGWRARLLRYADFGAAIAIGGGAAALMLMRGSGATGLSTLLFVVAIGWITWKRHALWDIEMSFAATGSEAVLDSTAESTRARLKRTNLSLLSLIPVFALGLWFAFSLYHPEIDSLADVGAYARSRPQRTLLALGAVAFLFLWLLRSRRILNRDLERIEAMLEQYREEDRNDCASAATADPKI